MTTRFLDTGAPLTPRETGEDLVISAAWTLIPEDQTNHQFTGDAVLRNDKLTVVCCKRGPHLEIFAQTPAGLKHRASLGVTDGNSGPVRSAEGLSIVENTAAAVSAAERFPGAGTVRFRLTTGEPTLEVMSGDGGGYIELQSKTHYAVVPDYFGDDVVLSGKSARRLCLPAENFCLNLLEDENGMIMTVWQSNEQDAWFESPAGEPAGLCSTRIRCLKDRKIWLAFFEAAGIWHQASSADSGNWKPPFPAKWRVSQARENGAATSWDLEKGLASAQPSEGPVIIYPLDRSTATPLTATCTTDVMRNTLGVGPCQYILACEGLGGQGDPTPNSVMTWVEKQFEQKKQKKAADDILQRLELMNQHVAEARARIERYREFAANVQKSLSGDLDAFRSILENMQKIIAAGLTPGAAPERSRQLADQVTALVAKDNSLEECRRLGQELRAIGAVQDSTLAKCRMGVRRLRAEARSIIASRPQNAESAQFVQRLTESMLRTK